MSIGDVIQQLDETGKIIKTYEHDAFGNEEKPDKKDDKPFCYAGEYFDLSRVIYYLRARYYNPENARFITRESYTKIGSKGSKRHQGKPAKKSSINLSTTRNGS